MVSEYDAGDHLLRVADGVLEQFSALIAGSLRIPVAWMAVELKPGKHDVVQVQIGRAADRSASIYSEIAFTNPNFSFEIPAADEPQLRAFLDQAAAAANRSP